MRHLFSRERPAVLAHLARARTLVAFDFDGTLAPIVARRGQARMRARTAALFARLCRLYPCAVISGRSRADVAARLGEARVRYVVGNHGLERGRRGGPFERTVSRARALLADSFDRWPGAELEDKRYSLALHYRRSADKRLVRRSMLRALAATGLPLRIVPGKLLLNVVPMGAPNKGDALVELRAAARAETALYVGDDVTDEDAFALDEPGRLETVRVGRSRRSAAAYFLEDQKEIDTLLASLIQLREGARSRG